MYRRRDRSQTKTHENTYSRHPSSGGPVREAEVRVGRAVNSGGGKRKAGG